MMIMNPPVPAARPRRSLLFVPGNRPQRFAKAFTSGADIVCMDLEDAVPAAEKDAARQAVRDYLQSAAPPGAEVAVRINALPGAEGDSDMRSLWPVLARVNLLILPKTESVAELKRLSELLAASATAIVALIETPLGLLSARQLLVDCDCAAMVMLGGADLSAATGASMTWDSLYYARSHLLLCAAPRQLGSIDVPFLDIDDSDALRAETRRIRELGFTTKAAIHPKQIAVINQELTPSAADIQTALNIIAADRAAGGAAVLLEGKMIDAPLVQAARRTVGIAGALGLIAAGGAGVTN